MEDEFDVFDCAEEHSITPVATSPVKQASSPTKRMFPAKETQFETRVSPTRSCEKFQVDFPARRPRCLNEEPLSPEYSREPQSPEPAEEGPSQSPQEAQLPSPSRPRPRRTHHTMEIVAGWRQERQLPDVQLIGISRHAERADASWALVNGSWWHRTEDFAQWPTDPPLSDNGVEQAQEMGREVRMFAEQAGAQIHVIVTSPYWRCIQTSAEICRELGESTKVLIDRTLGEVYGPSVMGNSEPHDSVRPISEAFRYFKDRGVCYEHKSIGKNPEWPEDLRKARWRFATRVLTYMRRSVKTRRNFLVVSHADCVGAALALMPSEAGKFLEKVGYGGMFLAKRGIEPAERRRRKSLCVNLRQSSKASSCTDDTEPLMQHELIVKRAPSSSLRRGSTCPARLFEDVAPQIAADLAFSRQDSDSDNGGEEDAWRSEREGPPIYESIGSVASKASLNSISSVQTMSSLDLDEALDRKEGCAKTVVGWQVQTYRIQTSEQDDYRSSCVDKRIRALVEHSRLSREVIELLLGTLSDLPLSSQDKLFEVTSPPLPPSRLLLSHTGTYSTFLFGASNSDLGSVSQVPSRAGTASLDSSIDDRRSRASSMESTRSGESLHDGMAVSDSMGRQVSDGSIFFNRMWERRDSLRSDDGPIANTKMERRGSKSSTQDESDDCGCRLKTSAFSLIARRRNQMQTKQHSDEAPSGLPSISTAAHQVVSCGNSSHRPCSRFP